MQAKYKTIKGIRYKVKLLELATRLTQTGPLHLEAARRIWFSACDGNKVTETEKNTIRYIIEKHSVTDEANTFFEFWLQADETTNRTGAGVVVVDGVRCDAAMIEVAEIFFRLAGGRPLSVRAAEGIWGCALDGRGITRREKDTWGVVIRKYEFQAAAEAFLENKSKWLGIAQSAAEVPAIGERVTIAPDAIVLRTADALALTTLPAPTHAIANPLLDARRTSSGREKALPSTSHQSDFVAILGTTRLAAVDDQSNFLTPEKTAVAKRNFTDDAKQETSAPKRQKRADAPGIRLQELRDIFDKCDRVCDGIVNKREMILSCREHPDIARFLGLPTQIRQEDCSRNQVEEIYQAIDVNSDREITWAEILAYYRDRLVDM